MVGKILRCLAHATPVFLGAALILVLAPRPVGVFAANPSTLGEEQKQTEQERAAGSLDANAIPPGIV